MNAETIREEIARAIGDLLAGNGFGSDYSQAELDEWAEALFMPLARKAQAEALRGFATSVNLHRQVPDDRDDLAHLCEDDDCLWWDMTYALQDEINSRADRIEQNSEGS